MINRQNCGHSRCGTQAARKAERGRGDTEPVCTDATVLEAKPASEPRARAQARPTRTPAAPGTCRQAGRYRVDSSVIMGTSVSKWEDDAAAQEVARRAELDKVGRPPHVTCALLWCVASAIAQRVSRR